MGTIITTRDSSGNTELSVGQSHTHSVDLDVSLSIEPNTEHPKPEAEEYVWLNPEQTVIIIFQMVLLIFLCICGTLTNSLVFWVFNRRPALRSLSNKFVLSLVTANILISSIIAPLMIFEKILSQYLLLTCITHFISTISSSVIFSAIFSTFLIATDRFYAVTSPLHYSMTITRSRSQIMIVLAWISGTVLSMPYVIMCFIPINSELHQSLHIFFTVLQIIVGYVCPFGGLCWLYLRMYHAAHRNSERTRKHSISGELLTVMDGSTSVIPQGIDFLTHYMNPFSKTPMVGSVQQPQSTTSNTTNSLPQIVPAAVKKSRRRSSNGSSSSLLFREEGRAIKTAFLVLASFLACWSPHFLRIMVNEIDVFKKNFSEFVVRGIGGNIVASASWMHFFGVVGMLSSSVVNPFIYVFRNKMACKEVSKLLCGFFRDKRPKQQQHALRERHSNHTSRDTGDDVIIGSGDEVAPVGTAGPHSGLSITETNPFPDIPTATPQQPPENYVPHYSPCPGKSPKRSSMKSLTPQSSLNSTATNCNSINGIGTDSPLLMPKNNLGQGPSSSAGGIKPPFLRSLTLPEQSQPRVKFPPNLIRQKSLLHRPVNGYSTDLTPALSKRSRFVRQDSICSIMSNDSVLMICADDGLSITDINVGSNNTGSTTNIISNNGPLNGSANGANPLGCSIGIGSTSSSSSQTRNYLRQDSNFSDSSYKTNDSGVVLTMCNSSKQIETFSPELPKTHKNHFMHHNHHHHKSPCNHCSDLPLLQTTI